MIGDEEEAYEIINSGPQARIPEHMRLECDREFLSKFTAVNLRDCTGTICGTPIGTMDGELYVDTSVGHVLIVGATGTGKTLAITLPRAVMGMYAGHSVFYQATRGSNIGLLQRIADRLGIPAVVLKPGDPRHTDGIAAMHPIAEGLQSCDGFTRDEASGYIGSLVSSGEFYDSQTNIEWIMGARSIAEGAVKFVAKEVDGPEMNTLSINRVIELVIESTGSEIYDLICENPEYNEKFGPILLKEARTTQEGYKAVYYSSLGMTLGNRTYASILNGERMEPFEMDEKQILVILITPEGDPIASAVSSMVTTLVHEVLIHKIDSYGGKSKTPIDFILDEFGCIDQNVARRWLPQDRERRLTYINGCQSLSQIARCDDSILDNFRTIIFTGSSNIDTLEAFARMVTVDKMPLISSDQLRKMRVGDALILIRGMNPYFAKMLDVSTILETCPLVGPEREYVELPTIGWDYTPKSLRGKKRKKMKFEEIFSDYQNLIARSDEEIEHDDEKLDLLHNV